MSQERHPTEDLPAYALGALEPAEREVVAAHLATCVACSRDLAHFEDAVYEAAAVGAVNVEPPGDLRTRIVLRHRGARVAGRRAVTERVRDFLVRPIPAALPLALSVLVVVALAFAAATRQEADAYARAVAGVADGRVVALTPAGTSPEARAAVVIPTQGGAYLIVRLPPPPSGKAWEAWVLKPGPRAVPAGTAEAGGVFVLSLTAPLGAGDGVAITLEPAAGSRQPTTQPVLAVERT
jgi:anti-sigma factor RsiW